MPTSPDIVASQLLPLWPEETEETILARWQAWANEGLTPEDVDDWVDTRPGNHWFITTAPGIREAARWYDVAGSEMAAAAFPIFSWGEYLDDHGAVLTIERVAATPAGGYVTFVGAVDTVVTPGVTVAADPGDPTDPSSPVREYQVTDGGVILANLGEPLSPAAAAAAGGTLVDGTYYYCVTALSAEGETGPSVVVNATTAGADNTVDVSWDAVPGATGYNVYRGAAGAGPFGFLATTVGAAYSDTGAAAPDSTKQPPLEDTTGGRVTLPVESLITGTYGNVAAAAVNRLSTAVEGITAVTNKQPLLGGSNTETDESLRERLLKAFGGRGPGTVRDYLVWMQAYGVARGTVIPVWDGPGTVLVIALTEDGQPVSPATVSGLQAYLDPVPEHGSGAAPIGPTVTVITAVLLDTTVAATVQMDPGFSLDGAGATIATRDSLNAAAAPYIAGVPPGQDIVCAQIAARLLSVVGVHDVGDITINGVAANLTLGSDPAQVANVLPLVLTEGTP